MIVVDLVGGDNAPLAVIEGALLFKKKHPESTLILCGTAAEKKMIDATTLENCQFIEADCAVKMENNPLTVKLGKSLSTLEVGLNFLKNEPQSVFFSAGNSGAIALTAKSILGLQAGIDLPIFAPLIPLFADKSFLLLDAGVTANRHLTGENLFSFAQMGAAFFVKFYDVNNPTVALLNVGTEKHKGRVEQREAYQLLTASDLNFVGNVEPEDLLLHKADIVVTDGFTGNLVLKMMEAFSSLLSRHINKKSSSTETLSRNFDYEKVGGAPLLGLNGKVVVGHGKSTAKAICSGLEYSCHYLTISDKLT